MKTASAAAPGIRTAFLGDGTRDELAKRKNVPLRIVKSWISYGLVPLRACLDPGPADGQHARRVHPARSYRGSRSRAGIVITREPAGEWSNGRFPS
jgi:hypothetical protein